MPCNRNMTGNVPTRAACISQQLCVPAQVEARSVSTAGLSSFGSFTDSPANGLAHSFRHATLNVSKESACLQRQG
jgi:hypothetical protein